MGHEAFDDYEQCSADDWVKQVVVSKLGYKNSSKSVNLKPIPPLSEIKLQKLIDAFCLIICFQMKGSRKLNINVHAKAYLFPEVADKLEITIWYNEIRSTVFPIEFSESGVIYTDSINFSYRHKYGVFWEAVHNNHHIDADLFMSVGGWR